MAFKVNKQSWKLIEAISNSLSISEISRKTGIPKTTVWRKINNLFAKTRIRFIVSSKALKLKPVVVIFQKSPSLLPRYTISLREINVSGKRKFMVIGFVPEQYVAEYLSLFDKDPEYFFEYDERIIWSPYLASKTGSVLNLNDEIIIDYNKLKDVKLEPSPIKKSSNIDAYDLLIIRWKEHYAFISLTEISKRALNEKIKASRQVLSYHFKKHVLPIWIGNQVRLYKPMTNNPFRAFILKCENAEELAFKLSLIPYIYTIYYSNKIIFFTGQPTVKDIFQLYDKILSEYSPEPLLCETYIKPSFHRFVIKYNKLWNKGWIKPTVAYKIKVKK